jgi:thiamine pyrophosphokinase
MTAKIILIGPLQIILPKDLVDYKNYDVIIFVDGGLKHHSDLLNYFSNDAKKIFIGDNDSSIDYPKTYLNESLEFQAQKDFTDLEGALAEVIKRYPQADCDLIGFCGARLDHELSNLSSIVKYSELLNITLLNFHAIINCYAAGIQKIEHQGLFSITPFEKQKLKVSGDIKYSLDAVKVMPFTGQLISNIAHGVIKIENSGFIFVHKLFEH